ncbi:MAG: glycosyltransferase [Candidatus Thorarchaeota archaeon]
MIFVTVGTSLPHDDLIRRFDQLVETGELSDEVIAQIGAGSYIPRHIKYFRFSKSLEKFFEQAEVVVTNCGAGTILENTTKGRRLVAIQNPDITGGHEWELVTKMEQGAHLIWCKDIENLLECINEAKRKEFMKFQPEILVASDILNRVFKK